MRKKLSIKFMLTVILSFVLFCMPAGAYFANGSHAAEVHAQEETEESSPEEKAEDGNKEDENTEEKTGEGDGSEEGSSEKGEPGSTEGDSDPEEEKPGEDGSGKNDPEETCICKEKCSPYETDPDCKVCSKDYQECAYVNPSVKITILTPSGWHNDTTKVPVSVEDVVQSGNFFIQKVQAKVAQNGSWMDITEDMYVEISENSTVYVQVTDQKGKIYEKNRYIKCFDFTKPTLNAAVNDGMLRIQAQDTDSGVKAIYVNGYEFTDLTNGALCIRLQQFDAGYQYFTISAMDYAGNSSEIYRTANPYYTDPESKNPNEKDPAQQLPVDATATKPGTATAEVTEHIKTDSDGNTTSETKAESTVKTPDTGETKELELRKTSEQGKEFYTIQTASEKVFYLIIDRNGEEEKVYFLTEVSERDLLNTTTDNSETLPQNSAALESAIPTGDAALANDNDITAEEKEEDFSGEAAETEEDTQEKESVQKEHAGFSYLLMGIAAVVVIGAVSFMKAKKKKEDFIDDEDEELEDDYEEEYDDEEEEETDPDEEFLNPVGEDTESDDSAMEVEKDTEDGEE